MKVLIACEESQAVCKEFRKLGHEAYSCDILECSGGRPEWHICGDALEMLVEHYLCGCGFRFSLDLGKYGCPNCGGDNIGILFKWDMVISFPPCTHLAVSGSRHFEKKQKDGRQPAAVDFFMEFTKLDCRWAIENPIGIMSTAYREPNQIIHPYYFGDPVRKATCLWLNGLQPLRHLAEDDMFGTKTHVDPEIKTMTSQKTGRTRSYSQWEYDCACDQKNRARLRSKTFPGIALAMVQQWGGEVESEKS